MVKDFIKLKLSITMTLNAYFRQNKSFLLEDSGKDFNVKKI